MKRLLGILVWLTFGWSLPAQAALVELDWLIPGDKKITKDTTTGLEWLDVSETASLSYNQILAGFGSYTTTYGFRLATLGEFNALIAGQSLAQGSIYGASSQQFSGTDALAQRLGPTNEITGDETYGDWKTVRGWLLSPGAELLRGFIEAGSGGSIGTVTWVYTEPYAGSGGRNAQLGATGAFLVRDSGELQGVPGPFPILGAVAAFAYLRRVRKAIRAELPASS